MVIKDAGFSYIARCKCGEVVCAVVDNPDHASEVARLVSGWIRDGLAVERVTHDVVRSSFSHCRCAEAQLAEQPRLF